MHLSAHTRTCMRARNIHGKKHLGFKHMLQLQHEDLQSEQVDPLCLLNRKSDFLQETLFLVIAMGLMVCHPHLKIWVE